MTTSSNRRNRRNQPKVYDLAEYPLGCPDTTCSVRMKILGKTVDLSTVDPEFPTVKLNGLRGHLNERHKVPMSKMNEALSFVPQAEIAASLALQASWDNPQQPPVVAEMAVNPIAELLGNTSLANPIDQLLVNRETETIKSNSNIVGISSGRVDPARLAPENPLTQLQQAVVDKWGWEAACNSSGTELLKGGALANRVKKLTRLDEEAAAEAAEAPKQPALLMPVQTTVTKVTEEKPDIASLLVKLGQTENGPAILEALNALVS